MAPATSGNAPLSALFAINKPSGMLSMHLLNELKLLLASSPLFRDPDSSSARAGAGEAQHSNKRARHQRKKRQHGPAHIKLGQGGTLDPLADGVLVVATNKATKQLSRFIECTKEYRAIGLLGAATDSYDADGRVLRHAPHSHVTRAAIERVLPQFRGEIEQIPPIFSALKMDGKPLYEYARESKPLPRPIAARKVTVHALRLTRFSRGAEHSFDWPTKTFESLDEKAAFLRLEQMVEQGQTDVLASAAGTEDAEHADGDASERELAIRPAIFEVEMTVSSGTYVRTIIHDIARALGSAALVVSLTRTRQGEFVLEPEKALVAPASPAGAAAPEHAANATAETTAAETTPETAPETPAEKGDDKPVLETFPGGCLDWAMLKDALEDVKRKPDDADAAPRDGDNDSLLPWETELLHKCKQF